MTDCPLCRRERVVVLWQDDLCRVIAVMQPGYPGLCRVIWHALEHEMTELAPAERAHLMHVVWAVEAAQRAVLRPDKGNLSSLCYVLALLHWHVIPRFQV